jgi:hypothetical protein
MSALHSHCHPIQIQLGSKPLARSAILQLYCQKKARFCRHFQPTAAVLLRHRQKHSLAVSRQQGAAQVHPYSTPPHITPTAAHVPSSRGCQHDIPTHPAQNSTHRGGTDNTLCCHANKAAVSHQQQCIPTPPRGQCCCLVLVRRAAKAKAKARARNRILRHPGLERTPQ